MKKILSLSLAVVMLCVLVLSLASCSTYGSIEKRFVKAGYEVVNTEDDDGNNLLSYVSDFEEDGEVSCTVHILKKKVGTYAFVLEFGADKDAAAKLDELLTDADYKTLMEMDDKSDFINGNCVLVPVVITLNIFGIDEMVEEMTDLFQED